MTAGETDMETELGQYYAGLLHVLGSLPVAQIARVEQLLFECYQRRGTVFVAGNGGSAATASHFACDLAKGTRAEGLDPFRVMPLTDNVPLITAWANDKDFECVFAEQLMALARPGDVALLISVSGNSPNVLLACTAARDAGATTVAFTGRGGGRLVEHADVSIQVDAQDQEPAEDIHLILCHSLCVSLRTRLRELSSSQRSASATPTGHQEQA